MTDLSKLADEIPMTPSREAELKKEFEAKHGPEPILNECLDRKHWSARCIVWDAKWIGYLSAHTDSQMSRELAKLKGCADGQT